MRASSNQWLPTLVLFGLYWARTNSLMRTAFVQRSLSVEELNQRRHHRRQRTFEMILSKAHQRLLADILIGDGRQINERSVSALGALNDDALAHQPPEHGANGRVGEGLGQPHLNLF